MCVVSVLSVVCVVCVCVVSVPCDVCVVCVMLVCRVLRACSVCVVTGWRRLIGCLKLQVIFHQRSTNSRALLRKMTYKDKASYDSTPTCNIVDLVSHDSFH